MKFLPLLILPFVLFGCAGDPVVVDVKPIKTPPVELPIPAPPNLTQFHWKVLNQAGLQAMLNDLSKHPNANFVLYTMDSDGVFSVFNDLVELKKYIQEQQKVIAFCKQIQDSNSSNNTPDQQSATTQATK